MSIRFGCNWPSSEWTIAPLWSLFVCVIDRMSASLSACCATWGINSLNSVIAISTKKMMRGMRELIMRRNEA